MIKSLYRLLPGPSGVRVTVMVAMVAALLVLVIWSYELLGDVLDTEGQSANESPCCGQL